MKHLGDITKLKGSEVPAVDIVVGGSPCQDLSIAGGRAGLSGKRSGLFMEQIRVIKEMRNECIRQLSMRGADVIRGCVRPRFMVWENVPGAFSSNGGEDFKAVLEETAKVADENAVIPGPPGGKWPYAGCIVGDGWSIAWRLHDSQWWGVPQRRKRICLLADFEGQEAGRVLFELRREADGGNREPAVMDSRAGSGPEVQSVAEGLHGNPAPSGKPVIVLGSRVEYLQRLCQNYTDGDREAVCLSGMGNSKGAKELRKKVLSSLNDGEIDAVFATYQLAKEGLDVPNLRYVVFATPEKDETTIIQAVGRVGRSAEGKSFGTVLDFVDDFGMYKGWAKKRSGYYKKIGAELIFGERRNNG